MNFKNLEDRLQRGGNGNLNKYLEIFPKIPEPTNTILGYTLDISSYLETVNLADEYVVFGGYAVLSHLMDSLGEDVAKVWRGSTDIDMAGTKKVAAALKAGYHVASDKPSPNLENKRTLKIVQGGNECKVDFAEFHNNNQYFPYESNKHFGIPLKVANPLSLIKSKLKTPIDEKVHSLDILGMITVLERRGYSPQQVLHSFNPDQKYDLLNRIKIAYDSSKQERLGFVPTPEFREYLIEGLKDRIAGKSE